MGRQGRSVGSAVQQCGWRSHHSGHGSSGGSSRGGSGCAVREEALAGVASTPYDSSVVVDVAKDAHLTDPALLNNERDESVSTTIIGYADLKISVGDLPEDLDWFGAPNLLVVGGVIEEITIGDVLHNNGPYGPVEAEVEMGAWADADCEAQPNYVTQQEVLDVDVPVVKDHLVEVQLKSVPKPPYDCEIEVVKFISVKDSHVVDPDGTNNDDQGTILTLIRDSDGDTIPDDGNFSGDDLDAPCDTGESEWCDDNSEDDYSPDQTDTADKEEAKESHKH